MTSLARRRTMILACGVASVVTFARAAPVDDVSGKVAQALSDCIKGGAPAGTASTAIEGLGRDASDLQVVSIPTAQGRLYAYRNTQGAEVVCGVALYDAESKAAYNAVLAQLRDTGKFIPMPLSTYTLATPPAVSTSYLGNSKAPGLAGVLVLQRPAGAAAPTLQVDYHSTLVH